MSFALSIYDWKLVSSRLVYVCCALCYTYRTHQLIHIKYIIYVYVPTTSIWYTTVGIHSDLVFSSERSDSTHPDFLLIILNFFDVLRGHYFVIMVKYYLCKDVYWICWYKRQFWNHIKIFVSDWVPAEK